MVQKVSLYKLALKNFTGGNLNVAARKGRKGRKKTPKEKRISDNDFGRRVSESEIKMIKAQEKLKITIKNLKKKTRSL